MKAATMSRDTPTFQRLLTILARTRMAEASVFTYCVWQARDLITAWQRSPHDRLGWLPLIIWLFPILYKRSHLSTGQVDSFPLLLVLGLVTSFTGDVGSLNVLKDLGLAMALSGLIPLSPRHLFWTLTAISWMPLFGWLGSRWFPDMILPARLMAAVAGSGLYLLRLEATLRRPMCRT